MANARAQGVGGAARASSQTRVGLGLFVPAVTAKATAPVKSTVQAEAQTVIADAAPSRTGMDTLNAGAYATGDPLASDVFAATVNTPVVFNALNIAAGGPVLGLGVLGGAYPADGSGAAGEYAAASASRSTRTPSTAVTAC